MAPVTVAIAMSSGADSSVAAALLQEQGNSVIGLTWRPAAAGEQALDAVLRAERVALALGIEHHVVEMSPSFEEAVNRYLNHETGNGVGRHSGVAGWFPALLAEARRHGANVLATGHYARLLRGPDGRVRLLRASDHTWDQSWRLFALDDASLACVRFPVGEMSREEVLAYARRRALPVDPSKPAAPGFPEPDLLAPAQPVAATAFLQQIHWIGEGPRGSPFRAVLRTRRLHAGFPVGIDPLSPDTARVTFEEPPFGVMPGQPAAMYVGDEVVGGGWIGHM